MRGLIIGRYSDQMEEKINKIANDYKLYQNITVEKRIDSVHGIKIYFSNGDFWETIKYSPSLINTCGKRVNLIYIDRTIPEEDIPSFKACCTAPPYQGYYFF